MDSLLWAYLESRRFPRELSSFLVCRFFTLSSDDRLVWRRRFRSRSRLGAAPQAGFIRMTGATRVLLTPWRPGARQARRTRAAQVREHLAANARRVRPLLKHIIALDLRSVGPHPVIGALAELAGCSYRDDCTYLFYQPSSPAGHTWNELLRVAATIDEGWRSATDVLAAIRQRCARRSHLSGRPCAGSTAAHRVPVRLLCAAGLSQAPCTASSNAAGPSMPCRDKFARSRYRPSAVDAPRS